MGAFRDQVAVVTGASAGIGRGIALGLAAQAAAVVLVGRDAARLEDTAARARATSPHVVGHRADLAVDADIDALAARVAGEVGGVDILVHAAGVIDYGAVAGAPAAGLDAHYRTNLRAPYALTQALLPMLRARRGQVVFVNSSLGLATRAGAGQYAATKHALRALADTLRDEVNADGVRVTSVYPGRTASPRQAELHALEGRPYRPERLAQPEDVAAIVIAALGVARTAEITDIRIRPMLKETAP
ncbi:MAG TPA: SDR family NAD(P)-dependent oxidoreductase [Methylomirabilota bacterium]|jgi:NAD(P)-dependent dehydrogenase (short-subunit alcohol dehydrogenase family)|nr:SDR family NAD(P)-dependent oxidoreductase [Methylomirabilota bacterium]